MANEPPWQAAQSIDSFSRSVYRLDTVQYAEPFDISMTDTRVTIPGISVAAQPVDGSERGSRGYRITVRGVSNPRIL